MSVNPLGSPKTEGAKPQLSSPAEVGRPKSPVPDLDLNTPLDATKKRELVNRINGILQRVTSNSQLSSTGYAASMAASERTLMTPARAKEYKAAAKQQFPGSETLKNLGVLQGGDINKTSDGRLSSPIDMTPAELTECLKKCREKKFGNCDMQALQAGNQLRHELGIKPSEFSIFSNSRLSHNYVVLKPSQTFPKGAIVDPWAGRDFQEMNMGTKLLYKHTDTNLKDGKITENQNMMQWIDQKGSEHLL